MVKRIVNKGEVRWELQDLRERVILAEAEQVRTERLIREVVKCPANRAGRYPGPIPLYADPADAVRTLRALEDLAYLVRPGLKNRIKPGVLLAKWEKAASEATALRSELKELEDELEAAGVRLGR